MSEVLKEVLSALLEVFFYFNFFIPVWVIPIVWVGCRIKKLIDKLTHKTEKAQAQAQMDYIDSLFFLDIDGDLNYYEMH
ncbi:MAG: hypothetical protein KBT27_13365 [Prevotellaceae bacterium]|nr:hypothetical protein [Candidatus Faecinaster equi]